MQNCLNPISILHFLKLSLSLLISPTFTILYLTQNFSMIWHTNVCMFSMQSLLGITNTLQEISFASFNWIAWCFGPKDGNTLSWMGCLSCPAPEGVAYKWLRCNYQTLNVKLFMFECNSLKSELNNTSVKVTFRVKSCKFSFTMKSILKVRSTLFMDIQTY
jgi:hypothetical protein